MMKRHFSREAAFMIIFAALFCRPDGKPDAGPVMDENDEPASDDEVLSEEQVMMQFYQNALDTIGLDRSNENNPEGFDDYTKQLCRGVWENSKAIDDVIRSYAIGRTFERISKVSVAVMRIAIYEMQYVPDVPVKVAINEAVELAKAYDDEKASSFVNGILNTAADKLGIKNRPASGKGTAAEQTGNDAK